MSIINSSSTAKEPAATAPPLRRRRTKLIFEKKLADDEYMAAAIGDVEWLKQSLKDSGSEVNFDKNGLAAIHLAAIHGRLECLKLCIEKFKMDVNIPSSTGWRPIHLCISNQTGKRSFQCMVYLLENGALPSVTNDDGITPAHQAASEGHVQCLKVLIEIGAKIDGKDCRGNTPLDLAKLWGHRKCARILAAEMWHHDKTFVAKEIKQLGKIKMQNFLKELELEGDIKSTKGELEKMSLFIDVNDPKQWNEIGSKPNSKSKPSDLTIKENKKQKQAVIITHEMHDKENTIIVKDDFDNESINEEKDVVNKQDKGVKSPSFYNVDNWNISTKAENSPYIPGLEDDYPRDEYTKMPKVKGAPKYYEGKFVSILSIHNIDEDIKRKGTSAKLRKPKLPEEVIEKVLSGESSPAERGMIFKCKHIDDVHTKRKYDPDITGRSEAPLHLTNDVRSLLVKKSLILKETPKTSSTSSHLSSKTDSLVWMEDNFPLPLVMQTLQNMKKPSYYPNISEH
ncbi:ankyrin repeat and KH domain-containing protein 1 [Biomphalaria glabrata]|nr:ankyrin repeat and KH domain-containing protein 1-like [Biomphalaria glabrata]